MSIVCDMCGTKILQNEEEITALAKLFKDAGYGDYCTKDVNNLMAAMRGEAIIINIPKLFRNEKDVITWNMNDMMKQAVEADKKMFPLKWEIHERVENNKRTITIKPDKETLQKIKNSATIVQEKEKLPAQDHTSKAVSKAVAKP